MIAKFAWGLAWLALVLLPLSAGASNADLDTAFEAAMKRFELPGLAIGVIENGKVVYRRTEGELVVGSGRKINSATLFKIASNSKAMTASVLARMVDAGKLEWSDPVIKYLPNFRMHDDWVTRNMQVGDLLVHNSGLPEGGGDLMLWPEPNHFTRADILSGLAYIKPAYSFRAGYAYDNLLYVVAGEVAAAAGGESYEELARREVFAPLGLSCRVGEWKSAASDNIAQPHARRDGRNVPSGVDGESVPAITSAAAGGIRCSLDDMLTWARNWLVPDAAQLKWLSAEQRKAMWTARTTMPISAWRKAHDHTHYYAYAYGFRLADVDGEWTVSHTGTLSGMYSVMMLLPDRKSGFVMLTNGEGGAARSVLTEVLAKHFTRPNQAPSVDALADELARADASDEPKELPDTKNRVAVAASEIPSQLGVWRDPWFGEVNICADGNKVRFSSAKSPGMTGILMRVGNRNLVDWNDDAVDLEAWLEFPDATEKTLRMAKVDPEGDFSFDYEDLAFVRVGDCPHAAAAGSKGSLISSEPGNNDQQSGEKSMTLKTPLIDKLMQAYAGTVPGASLLVLHDGVPVIRKSYGMAELETERAATPDTNYRLASVTKQFTAAAILLLIEDGRLHLDDHLRELLPSLPAATRAITIRHLLTHTSGLIDYEDVMDPDQVTQLHDIDVLHLMEQQDRLYFEPGSAYRYSNGAYALMALIVEKLSGKSFPQFLKQRIFEPLGMHNTLAYVQGGPVIENRAYGYSEIDGHWQRTDQSSTSAVLGDGGIYSSIEDLARWDAALYDNRLLSDESRKLAFSPQVEVTGEPYQAQYGFGWRITGDTLWHSGETIGFRNVIVRWPERKLTVILLSNRNEPEPYRLALEIAKRFM